MEESFLAGRVMKGTCIIYHGSRDGRESRDFAEVTNFLTQVKQNSSGPLGLHVRHMIPC